MNTNALYGHTALKRMPHFARCLETGIDKTSARPGTPIKVQEDANLPRIVLVWVLAKTRATNRLPTIFSASSGAATAVVYSVQAARKAFPRLSESFVVLGHSQGGGAAWAVAQKHAVSSIPGYRGVIAISPATSILDNPEPFGSQIAATMAPGIAALYAEFDDNEFCTPGGLELFNKIVKLDFASSATISILFALAGNLRNADWVSNDEHSEIELN